MTIIEDLMALKQTPYGYAHARAYEALKLRLLMDQDGLLKTLIDNRREIRVRRGGP